MGKRIGHTKSNANTQKHPKAINTLLNSTMHHNASMFCFSTMTTLGWRMFCKTRHTPPLPLQSTVEQHPLFGPASTACGGDLPTTLRPTPMPRDPTRRDATKPVALRKVGGRRRLPPAARTPHRHPSPSPVRTPLRNRRRTKGHCFGKR